MSVRRSPTPFKQLLPYAKINGSHQMHAAQHHTSIRSRCFRWMHFVIPLLFVAVLSSYTTYLLLYQAPRAHFGIKAGTQQQQVEQQQHQQVVDSYEEASSTAAAGVAAALQAGADADSGQHASTADSHSAGTPAAEAGKPAIAAAVAKPAGTKPQRPPPLAPTDAAERWLKATGRRLRVAIVNEAPYHLEIVAGFLHVLAQLPVDVTWYQAGQNVPAFSAVDLLEMVGFNQLLGFMPRMRPSTDKPEPVDFAVFVSPEYFERETKVRRTGSCRVSVESYALRSSRGWKASGLGTTILGNGSYAV
jgi:hypothetical protein